MMIHNITAKHVVLMEVIWGMDTADEITSFVSTLPERDQRSMQYLIQVAQAGGDDVVLEQQTIDLIDAIRKR